MIERLRRLPTLLAAMGIARRLERHDRWTVEKLRAHRRERMLDIVRHAKANSPYYRERLAGVALSDDLDLTELPTLDKSTMLEHFDELVTDRRLTRRAVEAHLAELERSDPAADPLLFGKYRAMASGGTSGQRGVFVYGRRGWLEVIAGLGRCWSSFYDFAPKLPRRRFATIAADHPLHMSGRYNRSTDVGAHRMLRLDARAPIGELVDALNAFQPEGLTTYPTIAAQLAERQLAGKLRIAPRTVATSGEVRTAEMTERISAAWDREPFDYYGASEAGFMAADCDRHAGLHVFEDQIWLEVVDEDFQPVPPGRPGSRLLLTNLFNRTQPLIRYELNDLLTVSPESCPCGRPFPLLESVAGRSDDLLELPAASGGSVTVHPLTLRSPLARIAALSEYRIVYRRGELSVDAVLPGGDGEEACDEIRERLGAALAERGATALPIHVESVGEIPRHPHSGKLKAIDVESG